jgi:hypothetical protein
MATDKPTPKKKAKIKPIHEILRDNAKLEVKKIAKGRVAARVIACKNDVLQNAVNLKQINKTRELFKNLEEELNALF